MNNLLLTVDSNGFRCDSHVFGIKCTPRMIHERLILVVACISFTRTFMLVLSEQTITVNEIMPVYGRIKEEEEEEADRSHI